MLEGTRLRNTIIKVKFPSILVNGVMDNMAHWYLLREHDVTTGVELPKPTLLPADIRGASDMKLCPSPNLYCNSQGSPKPNRQKVRRFTNV